MGPAAPDADLVRLAAEVGRDAFAAACPFLLLYGQGIVPDRSDSTPTTDVHDFSAASGDAERALSTRIRLPGDGATGPVVDTLVRAIHKQQSMFENMITVGRAGNNDIVLPSTNVSKFHAYFQVTGGALSLVDAGSRNGTWVGDLRIPARGAPQTVKPGDRVRFGDLELLVLTAADCWDALHGRGSLV